MKRRYMGVVALLLALCMAGVARAETVPQAAINTRESVFRVLGYDSEYRYSGSGFVIAATEEHTYFATNYHVVESADTLTILLHNGATIEAEVVGYDTGYDICILRTGLVMEAAPLPLYTGDGLSSQDDLVGRGIYAVGYPASGDYFLDDLAYRKEDATITNGIISAVKQVTFGARLVTLLQMNAAINSGNSGGPLVNNQGNVVGINTLGIDDTQGMFGAVSVRHLLEMMDMLSIPHTGSNTLGAISKGLPTAAILGIALAAGALVFLLALLVLRRKRVTLHKLLERRLQGYAPEQALEMLAPVLQMLEERHLRGISWGVIDQHTLYLDADGALALVKALPWQKQDVLCKPVELYAEGARPGVYSDVYALGIALYCLLSNRLPQSALQRLQEDTLEEEIRALKLPAYLEQALLESTLLDEEARIHDVHALQEALRLLPEQEAACAPENNVVLLPLAEAVARAEAEAETTGEETDQLPGWMQAAVAAQAQLEEQVGREDAKQLEATVFVVPVPVQEAEADCGREQPKRPRALWLALAGVAAAMLLLGGAFLFINGKYRKAETLAAQWGFADAEQVLSSVPEVYRDTRRLRRYVEAGVELDNRNYSGAKEWFALLGPYRDAQALVYECDYREAEGLLLAGAFADAQARFQEISAYKDAAVRVLECDFKRAELLLSQESYEEAASIFNMLADKQFLQAEEMLTEVEYRKAMALAEQGAYMDAYKRLSAIPYHKDAPAQLQLLQGRIYDQALEMYAAKQVSAEEMVEVFLLIPEYEESPNYIAYLNVSLAERQLEKPADTDYAGWQRYYYASYLRRMEHWAFPPAQEHILRTYFNEFLYGRWEGSGKYFEAKFDESTGYVAYNMNFSGGKGKSVLIEDHMFRTTPDGGRTWEDGLRFAVIDRDTMDVYCMADGKTYRLLRQ